MIISPICISDMKTCILATSKCYDKMPTLNAVVACVKANHKSVLRHGYATFEIKEVSRSLLQQLARHHHINLTVRSQRYCEETFFKYVTPPSIVDKYQDSHIQNIYRNSMFQAQLNYQELIDSGVRKEDARMVLPGGCHTELVATGNFQSWFEFLETRLSHRSQWEIRNMAKIIHEHLLSVMGVREIFKLVKPQKT